MRIKPLSPTFVLLSAATLFSVSNSAVMAEELPDIKFSGRLMLDYDNYSALFLEKSDEGSNDLSIRRADISIKSDFYTDFSAKLKIDFSDGVEVKDAYIEYKGWDIAKIKVGKQKEPFGLERQLSSNNLLLIERSMISNAISPGRSYGLNASGKYSSLNWQLGYFQNDNDTTAITGRVVFSPWSHGKNQLHFGTSFSDRDLNNSDYRVNEKLEVYGSDSLIEGSKFIAESAQLNGVELLWQYEGFTALAEWQQAKVTANSGEEYIYDGGYYQMSYLLSGKNRKYKNGVVGNISKKNDWEITMRHSQFNLLDENSKANTWSVGVNYYFNSHLKLMSNLINAQYIDEGDDLGSDNALSLRLQYKF